MNRYLSPREVREEFINSFPEGVGDLNYDLWINISHLHLNWKNYRALYGTSPERIELLNWAASTFFGLLDGILLNDIVLAIARLTDPPRSVGKENASLAQLLERITPHISTDFAEKLQSDLEAIQILCETIRQTRNRILAHDDLATALQYHPDPLPGISRAYVEEIFETIRRFFGDIEEEFRGSRTSHEFVISANDGEALIYVLESAQEHEKSHRGYFDQKDGIFRSDE